MIITFYSHATTTSIDQFNMCTSRHHAWSPRGCKERGFHKSNILQMLPSICLFDHQGGAMVGIHYWYWASETVMNNQNDVGIEVAQVRLYSQK
jgi:hypothetical protein